MISRISHLMARTLLDTDLTLAQFEAGGMFVDPILLYSKQPKCEMDFVRFIVIAPKNLFLLIKFSEKMIEIYLETVRMEYA